ncbi:hypothetical protein [Pedobacter nutrimenti]|uniref:Uncharacterized protein n=1 Tax=Pedobacter nutrimenti TaxID=1241337 RepID=A0A318UDN0_9SPHI|nr:hypothetical protein [Pedobacter nutrimenti]PYF68494.1 hypothetical protein B0O44_11281 [Pedobacter nutrimenti]
MNVILSINFDTLIGASFEIVNPVVLPLEGEFFDCTWSDFIKNSETLELLATAQYEVGTWQVKVLDKKYSKDEVQVNILLFTPDNYLHQL